MIGHNQLPTTQDLDEVEPPDRYRMAFEQYDENDPRYHIDEISCASGDLCVGPRSQQQVGGAAVGLHIREFEGEYGTREAADWIICFEDPDVGIGDDPRHPLWWCEDCASVFDEVIVS